MGSLEEALGRAHQLGIIGGALDDHLAHARQFRDVITDPPRLGVDLGTGGGLPGLALAYWWPASRWALIEARQKRADVVKAAVRRLGMADRVDVIAADAQSVAGRPDWQHAADLVTARAFGRPAIVAECAAGFLAPGGRLVVSEPPSDDRDRWPEGPLDALGLSPAVRGNGPFVLMTKKVDGGNAPRARRKAEAEPLW